ncbi:STAS domain-containing protein [Streptomyces sp. NPDC001606]
MEDGRQPRARPRPGGPAPLLLETVPEHRPETGAVSVLKARGTVDAANAQDFARALAEHIEDADRTGAHPLLNLTEAYLACPAAVRALDRATAVLAFSGRALAVVQPRPHVREALRAAGLPGVRVHATPAAALDALEVRGPVAPAGQGGERDPARRG